MKKTLFSFVMLFMVVNGTFAQTDSYKQKTMKLLEVGLADFTPDKMKNSLQGVFETMLGSMNLGQDNDETKQFLDKMLTEVFDPYFESGEFRDDMLNIFLPSIQKEFNEGELDQLIELYSTPKNQELSKKSSEALTDIGGLLPAIQAIAMGQKAPAIEKAECAPEYRELFTKYYSSMSMSKMDQLAEQLGGKDNAMYKYMSEAFPEEVLKLMVKNYTLEDMKALVELNNNPLVQRYLNCTNSLGQDAYNPMTMKIAAKFMEFIQKYKD